MLFFLSLKKVHKLKSMSPTNNQLQKEIQKKQVDKRIYPVFGDNMGVCGGGGGGGGGGGCAIITSKNTSEYIHYKCFKRSVNNVLSVLEGWSFLNHTLGFLLHWNVLTLL